MSEQSFQMIPLKQLHESPTNPRKVFGDLAELAASIRAKGIYEPLLGRPKPNGKAPAFEIVFGHRRYRAAKLAELVEVPVMVREMSDKDVLEAQLIENCQRADLHPLEEAEGYRQLHETHGYSVEDLAVKVGKSRAYVYGRLKLCALAPKVREAFYKGKLPASHALLLARIPHDDLQAKALAALTQRDEVLSYREAVALLQREYMLRLSEAPFDTTDAKLLPAAGACSTCPKRTGNQRELFDDVKSPDVCTDPVCFASKRDTAWVGRAAELEAQGHQVLTDKEAKKVVGQYGLQPEARDRFAKLDEHDYRDPKHRTLGTLLGAKHGLRLTIVRDTEGKVHELVDKREAQKVLREKHDWAKPAKQQKSSHGRKPPTGRFALEEKTGALAIGALVAAAAKKVWPIEAWQALATVAYHQTGDAELVLRRRGLLTEAKGKRGYHTGESTKAMHKLRDGGSEADLRGLVVELLAADFDGYMTETGKVLMKGFGVDLKPFEKEAARLLEQEQQAAKDKPAKKKAGAK